MNEIAEIYSSPQTGGELPYFIGKQYGSGWLKTLGRFAFPILKRLGRVATKTASDVLMKDKSILPSLKEHAIEAASQFMQPVKRKKKSKNGINKRRKRTIFER